MKAKIMIIEDDEFIRKNLVTLFSSLNYEVTSSNTAEDALETLKMETPDIIISDIILPKMSGLEFKKILNEQKETFEIPFVFLTSRNTYQDLRIGMQLGADDYIFKPFSSKEIIESVEMRLLKNRRNDSSNGQKNIFIKVGTDIQKIALDEIVMLLSENQYSRIFLTNQKKHIVRRPLTQWEEFLDDNFLRVSRSAIININKIEKIETKEGKKYLRMENYEDRIKITHFEKIKDRLLIK